MSTERATVMKPSSQSLEQLLHAMEHLGDDGLPAYPPPKPWPAVSPSVRDGALWVFGYGSLIWHPGFPHLDAHIARLHGYHRDLCVWSWVYRGTVDRPGLVLGLDRGGCCTGVAFRVPQRDKRATVAYLYRRELTTGVYRPLRKSVLLDDGRRVQALAFVVDREQDQYAGRMPFERVAAIVREARGRRGRNVDYVRNTVEHLEELGIPCRRLDALLRAVDDA